MNKNVTSEATAVNAPKTKRGLDLSPIQVIAGGGAAAVASVIGGQLGLGGTVVGAFILSVVSAVAVPLFRASLEKSHEQLKRVVPRRGPEETKASPQMAADTAGIIRANSSKVSASPLPGEGNEAAPGTQQRRSVTNRARMAAAGTAAIFAIFVVGLGSVLGVQAATGMSLSSGTAALQTGISQVASNGANTRSTPVPGAQPSSKAADAGTTPTPESTSPVTASATPTSKASPKQTTPAGTALSQPSVGPTQAAPSPTASSAAYGSDIPAGPGLTTASAGGAAK
ncbi:hypothetical protein [Pseudarthrobacter enclensis]|uniref:Uncharacterized protein n=1 Tax=Pseudarthrobacter enclensis TaxID=993070 RepID=A0ABT9RTJ5_9MICC|nr:hypothetical protein [Pseudarthrobacter enclensis]MDP9887963.1 hypothetical protein [Pseudarthrobacter enclensis]